MPNSTFCGFINLIGRTNSGKSTLVNHLLHKNITITSRTKHTTRDNILGIHTDEAYQFIFTDTPGIGLEKNSKLNIALYKSAFRTLKDADVILMLAEKDKFNDIEENIIIRLKSLKIPVILAVNKIDLLSHAQIAEILLSWSKRFDFAEIVPISALKNKGLNILKVCLKKYLPESPFYFEVEASTNRNQDFLVSEKIREQIVRYLGDELPFSTYVKLEKIQAGNKFTHVVATIFVERNSQKGIVIGNKGSKLKTIGTQARERLEQFLNHKVHLQLWVKVEKNWSDNPITLKQLGLS